MGPGDAVVSAPPSPGGSWERARDFFPGRPISPGALVALAASGAVPCSSWIVALHSLQILRLHFTQPS